MSDFKTDRSNDLSDTEKTVFSGLTAGVVPIAVGTLLFPIVGPFGPIGGTILSAYCLVAGRVSNSDVERSVGGIFGQRTGWVIPTGTSWWFPPPLGSSIQKRRVDARLLARRTEDGGSIPQVQTKDGGQVEVQVTLTYRIFDVSKSANLPEGELEKRVAGLLDRQVRYFALGYESDSKDENKRLMNQKLAFSQFIIGREKYTYGTVEKPITDSEGNPMLSDIMKRCDALGIIFISAEVHDVNPPEEVANARNKQAAEAAQAAQEKEDMASLRKRVLELMWGTTSQAAIKKKKDADIEPLMTYQEALASARTARGDMTEVRVDGGGDFTKAEVIRTSGAGKRKGQQ